MPPSLSQALLNSLPLPVLAIDHDGHILELNDAAQSLLPDNSIGKQLGDLLPPLANIIASLETVTDGLRQEVTFNNSQHAELTVLPLPGYGWSVTLYDISARKESDKAKVDLIGEVAHDLKQPLAAVLSFSDVMQASGDLNPQQVKFLDRIRGAATRMAEQVHQLLDMAWIESGMKLTLVEVDIVALTQGIIDDLEPRATARQITLKLDIGLVPSVIADHNRLSQVITNLLTNAIKYSPDVSQITVKIASEAENVVFSVRDQGIGIAPEHLPNLFQRFHRIRDKKTKNIEGTGLGLYISRYIVEQHGGHIEVESTPGKGSVFTAILPVNVPTPTPSNG